MSRRSRRSRRGTPEPLSLIQCPALVGMYRSDLFHLAKGLDMGLEAPRADRDSLWDWIVRDLPQSLSAFRMPEERHVEEIADGGLHWVVTTFSAGWGQAAELREQERLRDLIRLYHDHGIRVLTYVSMTNLFARRFFRDVPGSEKWVQRDLDGNPVPYRGWKTDTDTRFLACVNHPDYREHQFEMVRRAMRFGGDGLMVDNVFGICYCDHCKAAFREFSRERTGAERVLPHEDLERADWSRPVIQLAAEFFTESIARFFADLRKTARRLNAEAVCTMNVHPPRWRVRPTFDFPRLVRDCDVVLSEDGSLPASRSFKEVFETGQLRELSRTDLGRDNIDHYRYLRAVAKGRPYVFDAHGADVPSPNHLRLALAEGFACGGALGYTVPPGYLPDREQILAASHEYLGFFREHFALYDGAAPVCQVAIVVSHRSMMWCLAHDERGQPNEPIRTDTHLWGMSQALIYQNLLFDYVLEEDLTLATLSRYRVAVLPNAVCLSDEALLVIDEFVRRGGNLVVTGDTALFDAKYERRREYGLAHLTGVRSRRWAGAGRVVRRILGRSRVAHLVAPIPRDYLLTSDPRLSRELAAVVRWCAHGRALVRVRDVPGVLAVVTRVAGVTGAPSRRRRRSAPSTPQDRLVCHFLNYSRYPDRDEPIERESIEASLDASLVAGDEVEALTPDQYRPRVAVERVEDRVLVRLARLRIYTVVVFEAAPPAPAGSDGPEERT